MSVIPNNTFTMTPDGKLVPVGEVTGTVEDYAGQQQEHPAWKDNGYAEQAGTQPAGTQPAADATGVVAGDTSLKSEGSAGGNTAGGTTAVGNTAEGGTAGNTSEKNIAVKQPSVWDGGFTKDSVKKSGLTIGEAMINYNQWAKENGKEPLDFGTVWAMFNENDPTKTVEDSEKAAKKAASQEKFERIGNFLSHLGNFIGTLQGAPSQQLESGVELSKRQQELKDKTLAQRKQGWQDIYSAYKQKKADELAAKNAEIKQQQLEMKEREVDAKIQKMKDDANLQQFKAETDREFKNASIELRYKVLEVRQALAEKRISIAEANSRIAALRQEEQKRANDLKEQGETTTYDKVTKSTKTPNKKLKALPKKQ